MVSRRAMFVAPLAFAAARAVSVSAAGKMTLALHQNTSGGAGYRGSLEGWARAGIKNVELTNTLLDGFLKTDSLQAARQVLTDLGLTPVMCASGVFGIWEPGDNRAMLLDGFKRRCEQFASLGLTRIYTPSAATQRYSAEDYKSGPDRMREVGDIAKQFGLTALIEATRASTYVAALPTMLTLTRASGNVLPLLDFYHFWSGPSKLQDLDLIRHRRNRARPFSRRARHAEGTAGSDQPAHSRRRRRAAEPDPAHALGQGILGSALGRAVPPPVPRSRSVRGRHGNSSEVRTGHAPGGRDVRCGRNCSR